MQFSLGTQQFTEGSISQAHLAWNSTSLVETGDFSRQVTMWFGKQVTFTTNSENVVKTDMKPLCWEDDGQWWQVMTGDDRWWQVTLSQTILAGGRSDGGFGAWDQLAFLLDKRSCDNRWFDLGRDQKQTAQVSHQFRSWVHCHWRKQWISAIRACAIEALIQVWFSMPLVWSGVHTTWGPHSPQLLRPPKQALKPFVSTGRRGTDSNLAGGKWWKDMKLLWKRTPLMLTASQRDTQRGSFFCVI